ncbi:hypothetical protein JOB18_005348, partial [Solea senegalensis]
RPLINGGGSGDDRRVSRSTRRPEGDAQLSAHMDSPDEEVPYVALKTFDPHNLRDVEQQQNLQPQCLTH